ncbi:MAG: SUKH-3 domain-containing protein [Planctomycetaceae bacterium]|nr:SUKH-3 domain-containing protein [Planctomycetaceae bacterium]
MAKLSKAAEKGLCEAGWTHNRSIDISEYEEWLTQNGYVINDLIRTVLAEFGGLHLSIPCFGDDTVIMHNFGESALKDTADFDVIEAEKSTFIENIKILEKYISGDMLIPIGHSYQKHITNMVSHSGKIYGTYVEFHLCGEDIYDYINGLYQKRPGKKIHVPEMEEAG